MNSYNKHIDIDTDYVAALEDFFTVEQIRDIHDIYTESVALLEKLERMRGHAEDALAIAPPELTASFATFADDVSASAGYMLMLSCSSRRILNMEPYDD